MKIRFLVIFFIAVAFVSKAQTVTDPWASMGGPTTPSLIAIDASNNLYVTNFSNSTISKITPAGTVTQAWATLAANTYPYGIVIDASGNLYTANRGPKTISKITPSGDGTSGSVIQTWANLGGDEAYTLAIDASGNLYVPYVSTNRIAKITPNGATGTINTTWVTLASGANPFSISFDGSGNLYSANSNNTISKITAAGSVTQAWATLAASSNPQFMVFDPTGNMYVSCWGTSKVAKINSSGTVTDNWSVGTNVWTAGIVLDGAGNVYTANHNNHTISKITPSGTVTQAYVTLANGANPFHLVKDATGNLYTNNMGNHTVTKISVPSVSITSSASGAVCAGTSVTFTATVTGISSPTYQWYKNGTAISSANSSTYSSSTLSNNDVIKVSAGDAIVTSSLIQNLDANNASSYSSGNTWTDLTMNGNSGTINTMSSGSVTIATEGTIKSFKYTKGLSYIAAPLSKTASMTFNVWAKTSSLSNYSSGTMLFNAGASGTGALSGGPDLFIAANKIFWNTYDGTGNPFKLNGTDITTTTASINDVNWHNFTVVVDEVANTASLYVDGILKGVAVYKDPRTYSSTALFIGGEGDNANITNYDLAWDGNISAFQSYSRALSLMEVVQIFNSKAAFFGVNSTALNVSNSITASITGSTPTFTVTGDGCANKTTLSTTSGLNSYAWYKDNVAVSGATSNVYTPTAAGVYKVEVTTGSCSSTSSTITINNCGNNAYGQMVTLTNSSSLISTEGGANFGTGKDISGKIFNTTNIASTSGTIGSATAVLGGVISSTTGLTSSVGIIYSTDVNFGTYSTTTIQSNIAAGTYTSTISGLSSSTNYFAKSFIVNKAGTTYGSVVNFTTSAPSLVSDGLVLNLDAGNSSSYSGTGSTWTDLSGMGNNGTLYNSVSYNSSNQGSLVFDGNGTNDGSRDPYVQLPMSTDFDFGSGDFTVEMWAYTTSGNTASDFVVINAASSSYAAVRLEYYNGDLLVIHSYDGVSHASGGASASFTFNLNVWNHIVVSRISGTAKVYVNGVEKASYSLPGSLLAQQNTRIGSLPTHPGGKNYSGNIATTRFYKGKGLSAAEISYNFNLLKSRFGL